MGKARLLVIDDELSNGLEYFIKRLGYEVLVVDSARKGLGLIRKGEKFDVIILDISMPEMDGFGFLDEFGPDKETAVIMLTAYDERKLAVQAMQKGAFDFVSKDEATEILDQKIKKAYEHVLMIREVQKSREKLRDFIDFEKQIRERRDGRTILKEVINVLVRVIPHNVLITAILLDKKDHHKVIECSPEEYGDVLSSKIIFENEFLEEIEKEGFKIKILNGEKLKKEPIFQAMAHKNNFAAKSAVVIPVKCLIEKIGFIIIHTDSEDISLTYEEKEELDFYGTQAAEIIKILKLIAEVAKFQTYKFNKGLIHEFSSFPFTFERGIVGESHEDKEDALSEIDRFKDLVEEFKIICSGAESKFKFETTCLFAAVAPVSAYTQKKSGMLSRLQSQNGDSQTKKIHLKEIFETDVEITADLSKLFLALKIIVDNAIEAIFQDQNKKEGELTIGCYKQGNFGVFKISDNGIGMEKEWVEKIFDPFESGKKGGWGVGLSFARDIIEEHGGSIQVRSELGVGTDFFINIPILNKGEKDA